MADEASGLLVQAVNGFRHVGGRWVTGVVKVLTAGLAFEASDGACSAAASLFVNFHRIAAVSRQNTRLLVPDGILIKLRAPKTGGADEELWLATTTHTRNDILHLVDHFRAAPQVSAAISAENYFDPSDPDAVLPSGSRAGSEDGGGRDRGGSSGSSGSRWFDNATAAATGRGGGGSGGGGAMREDRMLRRLAETQESAIETLSELQRQGEQIRNSRRRVAEIEGNLDTSDSLLTNMESWLSVFGLGRVKTGVATDVSAVTASRYRAGEFPCLSADPSGYLHDALLVVGRSSGRLSLTELRSSGAENRVVDVRLDQVAHVQAGARPFVLTFEAKGAAWQPFTVVCAHAVAVVSALKRANVPALLEVAPGARSRGRGASGNGGAGEEAIGIREVPALSEQKRVRAPSGTRTVGAKSAGFSGAGGASIDGAVASARVGSVHVSGARGDISASAPSAAASSSSSPSSRVVTAGGGGNGDPRIQAQLQRMEASDRNLNRMSNLIGNLKDIGLTMNTELDAQNKALGDLDDAVSKGSARINSQNRRIAKIT